MKEGSEPKVYEIVRLYVRCIFPLTLFNLISGVFHSVFRGIKANKYLVISSVIHTVVCVVLCYTMTPAWGIVGYFLARAFAWVAEAVYCLVVYGTGHWVPKDIRHLVLPQKNQETNSSPTCGVEG